MKVNPYLNFPGSAEEAFTFYKSIFGGETSVLRFKDMPPMDGVELSKEDAEKVMHVSLPLGKDILLMGSDALESLGQSYKEGNNISISLHPDSKEEADRIFQKLSEGGRIEMPIEDQFWGDYFGSLKDRFGIQWMVNYNAEF